MPKGEPIGAGSGDPQEKEVLRVLTSFDGEMPGGHGRNRINLGKDIILSHWAESWRDEDKDMRIFVIFPDGKKFVSELTRLDAVAMDMINEDVREILRTEKKGD
jgi:hypothetical protein